MNIKFGVCRILDIFGPNFSLVSAYCIIPEITLVFYNLKYFPSSTVTVEDLKFVALALFLSSDKLISCFVNIYHAT